MKGKIIVRKRLWYISEKNFSKLEELSLLKIIKTSFRYTTVSHIINKNKYKLSHRTSNVPSLMACFLFYLMLKNTKADI